MANSTRWTARSRTSASKHRRCGAIVRSLLQFAREEPYLREEHDLSDLIEDCARLTESYAYARGSKIHLLRSSAPVPVRVNASEIDQVVINLLRNAVEAEPRSGSVHLRVSRRGDLASIEVEDDGRGIAPVDLHRIFDPFFTTRLSEGGSGLGLSVAHGIVQDHGGQIHAESSAEKGTRFRVELPLAPKASA